MYLSAPQLRQPCSTFSSCHVPKVHVRSFFQDICCRILINDILLSFLKKCLNVKEKLSIFNAYINILITHIISCRNHFQTLILPLKRLNETGTYQIAGFFVNLYFSKHAKSKGSSDELLWFITLYFSITCSKKKDSWTFSIPV